MTAWGELDAIAPLRLPPALWDGLVAAYAEPPRAYHSFAHVAEVAGHWRDVRDRLGWERPAETFLAVLWHDAVYRAGRGDNEAESTALMRRACAPLAGIDLGLVERLIMLTARHGSLTPAEVDRDAALLLDCDMAILAAPSGRYDAYETAIREEYGHIPGPLFRMGRRRFLAGLLAAPRIFLSEDFHARLDPAARANLAAAIDRL